MRDKDKNWSESFWHRPRPPFDETYAPKAKEVEVIFKKTWDLEEVKAWFRKLKMKYK